MVKYDVKVYSRVPNVAVISKPKEDGYGSSMFKILSNLLHLAPQERVHAPITEKIGMKERNASSLSPAKFHRGR